ncbi:MAG: hypothetical protein U1E29_00865 [Coriobacteriia bacterium]|nr:hypothetical protein [Coriobacteriia bacterium]
MHCSLKHMVGVRANCQFDRCIYWRAIDDETGFYGPVCVLDHFALTSGVPDRLTGWLMSYKVRLERERVSEILRNRHSQHLRVG